MWPSRSGCGSTCSALELYTIVLGDRLGLYRVLADGRAGTAPELADEMALAEGTSRMARAAGRCRVLKVDETSRPRRPSAVSRSLRARRDAPPPDRPCVHRVFSPSVASIPLELADVAQVFRTGGGLAWHEVGYAGDEARDANRATFERDLAGWIRAAPEVHAWLSNGGGSACSDR